MDTFCVSASTLSRVSALSHETLPVTRIYHNSALPPPRKAPQRDSAANGALLALFPGSNPEECP